MHPVPCSASAPVVVGASFIAMECAASLRPRVRIEHWRTVQQQDRVAAVAAMGRTKRTAAIEWCMQAGEMPPAAEVREGEVDWSLQPAGPEACKA